MIRFTFFGCSDGFAVISGSFGAVFLNFISFAKLKCQLFTIVTNTKTFAFQTQNFESVGEKFCNNKSQVDAETK